MYSVTLRISDDSNIKVRTQAQESLNAIIDKLNMRHNESNKIEVNEEQELLVVSKKAKWMRDFLIEVRKLLVKYDVEEKYGISVTDIFDFKVAKEDEEIEDAVDYISSMVHVKTGLAGEGYIATGISYAYEESDVFYSISLKALGLRRLGITISTTLDSETEKENISNIIELLDKKIKSII